MNEEQLEDMMSDIEELRDEVTILTHDIESVMITMRKLLLFAEHQAVVIDSEFGSGRSMKELYQYNAMPEVIVEARRTVKMWEEGFLE